MAKAVSLTGRELTFRNDEFIVSKTDNRGRITYGNDLFLRLSGYEETELLGQPHSLIRHPHMPRAVFKLLWETIEAGSEIFAYVVNRAKSGDHYWVLAHVTPNLGADGSLLGYHSNRRCARPAALSRIMPIYDRLLQAERSHDDRKAGLAASVSLLHTIVRENGFESYDRFVLSL